MIDLRPLPWNDLARAARVHRAAQATIPTYPVDLHTLAECELFYRAVVATSNSLTGAYEGSELVGLIAVSRGWINHLYVDPARHGAGIGGCLLHDAMRAADTLELWTFQANTGAMRFYERAGFAAVEWTDGEGNEERLPDVRFIWRRSSELAHSPA